MSSPLHKYLFSPPPSPPSASGAKIRPSVAPLTSLKSLLLPTDLIPRNSLDGGELKVRSPKTPQSHNFTLDAGYPSSIPTRGNNADIEASAQSPQLGMTTPRRSSKERVVVASPANIPSTHIPLPSTLPRPLLRLLFLATLLVSSMLLLVYVPAARLPSLRSASMSRRLALAPDGRAYYDIESPVASWEEALERDYVPPQIKAVHMLKRGSDSKVPDITKTKEIPPAILADIKASYPLTKRPSSLPLPSSHEFLALQSYLLQSSYNVLPTTIDPQAPLDANIVLGYSPDASALEELEKEREHDVTVFYGGDGNTFPPNSVLHILKSIHGPERKPTLFPVHGRADFAILIPLLGRLGVPVGEYPVMMLGNTPIIADIDEIEEMEESGELAEMFGKIGWINEEEEGEEKNFGWTPKVAKVKKVEKEDSQVEEALRALNGKN